MLIRERLKKISLVMIIVMMFNILPWSSVLVAFANVDAGSSIIIGDISYVRVHSGKVITEGTIGIGGSGLKGLDVRIKNRTNGKFELIPGTSRTADEDSYSEFTLDATLTENFTGEMRIGDKIIDLDINNFPTITDYSTKNVNVNNGASITISGDNFDKIDGATPEVKAYFGRGEDKLIEDAKIEGSTGKISLTAIPDTVPKGFQRMLLQGTKTITIGSGNFTRNASYIYNNAFRIVGNLGLTNPSMSPNTGNKGAQVTITANNFNDSKKYKAFFLTDVLGGDDFSTLNGAETVGLAIDVSGTDDKLTVKVPEGEKFVLRNYNVVLTEVIGTGAAEEVIATQIIKDSNGNPDVFTVIGGEYIATLESVHPKSGSDRGADVQLIGNNIVSLNIPDLTGTKTIDTANVALSESDKKITIPYRSADLRYGGVKVNVDRIITAQIALPVTFVKNSSNQYYVQDTQDKLFAKTGIINDTETDAHRDVIVSVLTKITETEGASPKSYQIEQIISKKDFYEFIPYSLTPEITKAVPEKIQIEPAGSNFRLTESLLLSITGDKFLVDRDESGGEYITRYPKVLLKVQETLVETEYDIKIDPNEVVTYGGKQYTGTIRAPKNTDSGDLVLITDGANTYPAPVKMTVLNDKNVVVDGSDANSVGKRILVEIPKEALIEKKGFKNIHVINPQRDNASSGKEAIKIGILELAETANFPVIEEVDPKVVTVEGNVDVKITGTNIEEGIKLYIDGEEIKGYSRDIDPTGKKIILTFKAPAGREGTTQIQLVNSSGGMAIAGFTYVKSFNKDPVITNFAPTKGVADTLVLINGDNYLRPDPTVPNIAGVNAYRLVGTRTFLDGKDVNTYNLDTQKNISFNQYDTPNAIHFLNIRTVDPLTGAKEMVVTPFHENTYVTDQTGKTYWIDFDVDKNPIITDQGGDFYTFKYDGTNNVIKAYDKAGAEITSFSYGAPDMTFTPTTPAGPTATEVLTDLGGKTFTIVTDNNVFSLKKDKDQNTFVDFADYGEAVVFTSDLITQDYFVLYRDYDNSIKLSNGGTRIYTIAYDTNIPTTKLKAIKDSDGLGKPIKDIDARGFTITDGSDINLQMVTPYTSTLYSFDGGANKITGKKARVISKTQIAFNVPTLTTGKGFKDLAVVNPDTKAAKKVGNEGFEYISQASTHPAISRVNPDKGAVDGGYTITIYGKEYEDDMKVYIDSVLVPAGDTNVADDGKSVTVRVPKSIKDLAEEFGVDRLKVPVIVLNNDGGSAYKKDGFMYIIPTSSPHINKILPSEGTTIGGGIVEVVGYEFRFFEPYTNQVGGPEYNFGDPFVDVNGNGKWDDLLDSVTNPGEITQENFPVPPPSPYFTQYYKSDVMPKVYFDEKEAKVVEFSKGYLKVISPVHTEGSKDVYVVNNDSGISNKVKFAYSSSKPTITGITPAHGRKLGSESRDVYGTSFSSSKVRGYVRDADNAIVDLPDVQMPVQFGSITNRTIDRDKANSGIINANRTTVSLTGGLMVNYDATGANAQVEVIVNESNKLYKRTFTNYDKTQILIPLGMLKADAEYYRPNGFDTNELNSITEAKRIFEYIRIEVNDKRLLVDRGFAPEVKFDNSVHIVVTTPSYYTIDPVKMTVINTDGGTAESSFTYTNPASNPKIYDISPKTLDATKTEWFVQASIKGGIELEIKGVDFRDDVKVTIGSKNVEIVNKTTSTETIDGNTVNLDVLIVRVPAGTVADIDKKVPIILENTDKAVANSSQLTDLFGTANTKKYYFVYRKPLSEPKITSVEPKETTRAGGKTIIIHGTDFRDGATVIIGSKGGVPITNIQVTDSGKKITFITPTNLTIGDKDVQVINTDFGSGVLNNGIKIVSDPITNSITKEDGTTTVQWVSVEGGDKIMIKGEHFVTGAKVLFGGERKPKEQATVSGETGLFTDDKQYTVSGAVLATKVEFKDDKTLIVTTPEIKQEGEFVITVLNADTGISAGNIKVEYKEPVPMSPTDLKVELINNQYIKIYDYKSSEFDYFEIFYYIGLNQESTLKSNNYNDFIYLDTTAIEPYRITKLKGAEDLRTGEKIWFVIRALNKFGPSGFSNMVHLTQEQMKDVVHIGEQDEDGGLEVPDWKTHESVTDTTTITTHIGTKDLGNRILLDFTDAKYANLLKRVVTLPSEIVRENLVFIIANYGDSKMQFMPVNLNTEEFRKMDFYEKSYGKVTNEVLNNEYSSSIKNKIPRGYKAVSSVVNIEFASTNNAGSAKIEQLNGTMDLALYYGNITLSQNEMNSLKIYKYNTDTNVWDAVNGTVDTNNKTVYARIDKPGAYMLMVRRY